MHLYDALVTRLAATERRDGRAHADCPFCGKEEKRGQTHFSLCEKGYTCWVCGARGGLRELATHLRVQGDDAPRYAKPEMRRPTPPWETAGTLDKLTRFVTQPHWHSQIVAAWQRYKPLSPATILRERLTVAKLPFWSEERQEWYSSRYPRLIVPLIVGSRIVGMRGRAYERGDTGAKWITASHSEQALMGLDRVYEGCTVVWCENLVDRLLVEQDEPGVVAVASGGLSWQPGWVQALARRRPRRVIVWFDHDLAGNGGGADREAFVAQWLTEVRQQRRAKGISNDVPLPQPPPARGPQLAAALAAAGVAAEVYEWPTGTPRKADLGWLLEAQRAA